MFQTKKGAPDINAPKILDGIEKEAYALLKPYGFRKHGRTLHRFVDGDISQVVSFQLGQAYREETHLLWVNIGIRVPECMLRSFQPEETPKKYYHESNCNIRCRLGETEGKDSTAYDLREPAERITADILRQLQNFVLPFFQAMCSRRNILEQRSAWPQFDRMNDHLILLEEAMIYGRLGDRKTAEVLFCQYYESVFRRTKEKKGQYLRGHLRVLDEVAGRLGIHVDISE